MGAGIHTGVYFRQNDVCQVGDKHTYQPTPAGPKLGCRRVGLVPHFLRDGADPGGRFTSNSRFVSSKRT